MTNNIKLKIQLEKMLSLQDNMNSIINPNWREANNNWTRAAWIESAELMDWIGWKWWKAQTLNLTQAQIELIDIFHFLLSKILQDGITIDELIENYTIKKEDIYNKYNELTVQEWIEEFVYSLLNDGQDVNYYSLFAIICDKLELDFDKLYMLYIGKNVLNIFRQDHGYKEGNYIKQWPSPLDSNSEVEDNVYLECYMAEKQTQKVIENGSDGLFDYLYNKLEKDYPG